MELIKNNRLEIENEYLALIINHPELIRIKYIKPEWLSYSKASQLLKYVDECYKEIGIVDVNTIFEKHRDIDIEYYVEIVTETICYDNNLHERLRYLENKIVKYYKEDIIRTFNKKIENKQINYDEFVNNIKKLDSMLIIDDTSILTKEEILEGINDNSKRIILNNFHKLNRTLKIVENDFFIIGATTGAGKSGLLLNLMNDLMDRYQCIYFNMEMSKNTIYKRIISINCGVPMDNINNPETEYQKKLIMKSIDNIEKNKIIIEHRSNDLKQIESIIAKMKNGKKHTIVFIDHLGLCKTDYAKNLYEQLTEVAKKMRSICLDYDCTIIAASQLNRSAYSNDEMNVAMLKDSGEVENSASKVALLYRADKNAIEDSKNTKMIFNIVKNRDGLVGAVKMKYDKTRQIFEEEI